MENVSQKEKILLGLTLQRSLTNPSSSTRARNQNSEIDFHDVFGGPPRRRSSINETRYSFTETLDSFALKPEDDESQTSRSNSWSSLTEKPVFGEENCHRRRGHSSDDFYDDIFKGDESAASSPRKPDRDIFSSIPGSRILSPVRPLPPSAEPFGSSSLPAQLSLPTRLAKGNTELPPFGSTTLGSNKYKDTVSNSNGSHTNSPRFTLSRFSSISSQGQDDLKTVNKSPNPTSLLSSFEFNRSSEEASSFKRSDNTPTEELGSLDNPVPARDGQFQFHFSIYKWASKGVPVPLMMPMRGRNGSKSKSKEKSMLIRSSSATERVVKETNELLLSSPTLKKHNIDFHPIFHETENIDGFLSESNKEVNELVLDVNVEDQRSPCRNVEETISATVSENTSNLGSFKDVGYDTIRLKIGEKVKPCTLQLHENALMEKEEIKMTLIEKERKHVTKTLSSILSDSDNEPGEERVSGKYGKGDMMVKKSKEKSSAISHLSSDAKKQNKEPLHRNSKVEKTSSRVLGVDSRNNISGKKVGKVSDFVKIFNQEPASKSQDGVHSENQSSRRKQKDSSKVQMEAEKARMEATLDKTKRNLNSNVEAKVKVDNTSKQFVGHRVIKTVEDISSSTPNTVPISDGSKFTISDMEEPFPENFMIKELPQDYEDPREIDNGLEDLKVIDSKIRQWSIGKEGNIRSLLSTLQHVLWPESGWKPVPLVDIIEGNAVKRSYQKALLYLHPDKLQQKGASSNQKYTAAKIFDILQEAWTHFNTVGAL